MNRIAMILLAGCLAAGGCSRSVDDLPNPTNAQGDWKVQFYWDKKDETADFAGWLFRFHNGGHAEAIKGSQVISGTWAKTGGDFTLHFGTDPLLSELNSAWQIVEYSSAIIKLKDDNPAQDDQLTLQKL